MQCVTFIDVFCVAALALELNVEQYEYVTDVFNTAGARLIVHNQGIRPFPQEEGVNVAPGYHTNIGVTRVKVANVAVTILRPRIISEEKIFLYN